MRRGVFLRAWGRRRANHLRLRRGQRVPRRGPGSHGQQQLQPLPAGVLLRRRHAPARMPRGHLQRRQHVLDGGVGLRAVRCWPVRRCCTPRARRRRRRCARQHGVLLLRSLRRGLLLRRGLHERYAKRVRRARPLLSCGLRLRVTPVRAWLLREERDQLGRLMRRHVRRRLHVSSGVYDGNAGAVRAWIFLSQRVLNCHALSRGCIRADSGTRDGGVHRGVRGRRALRRGVHGAGSIRVSSLILLHSGGANPAPLRRRLLLRGEQHCCMQRGVRGVWKRPHVPDGLGFRRLVYRRVPHRIFLSRNQQPHAMHDVRRRCDLRRGARSKRMRHDLSVGLLLSLGCSDDSLQRRHVQCVERCEQRHDVPPMHRRARLLLRAGEHLTVRCRMPASVLLHGGRGGQGVQVLCVWGGW